MILAALAVLAAFLLGLQVRKYMDRARYNAWVAQHEESYQILSKMYLDAVNNWHIADSDAQDKQELIVNLQRIIDDA